MIKYLCMTNQEQQQLTHFRIDLRRIMVSVVMNKILSHLAELSYESGRVVAIFGELFLSTTLRQLVQSSRCDLGQLRLIRCSSA